MSILNMILIFGSIFLVYGFILFLYFQYKMNTFKKYIEGQKQLVNKLLSLENRKGKLLEEVYLKFLNWVSSEDFIKFIMTTLIVNSEIENITKNSATGIKRLSEALEPNVKIIQENLVKDLTNNFDSVLITLKKEIDEEMKNDET